MVERLIDRRCARHGPVRATVGGPIDTVLITKQDGLVWVKRKEIVAGSAGLL